MLIISVFWADSGWLLLGREYKWAKTDTAHWWGVRITIKSEGRPKTKKIVRYPLNFTWFYLKIKNLKVQVKFDINLEFEFH